MNVAIFSLTRDRLDYTRHCFAALLEKAGYPFDHFVIDNGSTDGTPGWLKGYSPHWLQLMPKNLGISRACNICLDEITSQGGYDLIISMDNDCEVVTPNILEHIVGIYEAIGPLDREYVLSPRVEGINTVVDRVRVEGLGGHPIGLTGHVGGLFMARSAALMTYRYPEALPLASGQDGHLTEWARNGGAFVGYVEDLRVNHYETTNGQARRYPEYFERKFKEEKARPADG